MANAIHLLDKPSLNVDQAPLSPVCMSAKPGLNDPFQMKTMINLLMRQIRVMNSTGKRPIVRKQLTYGTAAYILPTVRLSNCLYEIVDVNLRKKER